MNTVESKLYQEELEELTGKIYAGDFTPLLYELLKSTRDKEALILALGGEVTKKSEQSIKAPEVFTSFETLFANGLEVR